MNCYHHTDDNKSIAAPVCCCISFPYRFFLGVLNVCPVMYSPYFGDITAARHYLSPYCAIRSSRSLLNRESRAVEDQLPSPQVTKHQRCKTRPFLGSILLIASSTGRSYGGISFSIPSGIIKALGSKQSITAFSALIVLLLLTGLAAAFTVTQRNV